MLRRSLLVLTLGLGALGVSLPPASAETATCTAFKDGLVRGAAELKPEFVRPVVVSRGGTASGLDQFDLVSQARIDGVLRCRGEVFVSFEAKITLPADATLLARFEKAQEAALVAALRWPTARALAKARNMAAEAAEYLRASIERGDVSIAGKVEEHEPNLVDLGLIWTNTDRTFIVLVGS
jgi:hypothetical protein